MNVVPYNTWIGYVLAASWLRVSPSNWAVYALALTLRFGVGTLSSVSISVRSEISMEVHASGIRMSVLIQPSRAQPVTGPCTYFEVYKGSQLEKISPSLVLGHVLSPVRFLPRHSLFADCKLYIRTHLLASAFSNFWKNLDIFLIFISLCSLWRRFHVNVRRKREEERDFGITFVRLWIWIILLCIVV